MWTISSVTSPKGKLTLTECVGRKNFSWNHTVLICAYLRDLLFKWVCTCYLTEFLRVDPSVISIIQDITWTVKLQASLMCLLMAYFYSPLKSDKLPSHQNISCQQEVRVSSQKLWIPLQQPVSYVAFRYTTIHL